VLQSPIKISIKVEC